MSCLLNTSNTYSEQDTDNQENDGLDVNVSLRHRVIIPQIIYFRVGSATFDSVDKVTIDLTQDSNFPSGTTTSNGTNPLGSGAPVSATSNGTLDVDLRSNVGTITLSYQTDNPLGLADGNGNFIPYSEIDTTTTLASLTPPTLDNAAANTTTVAGNLYSGRVVNLQGQWIYSYKNTTIPIAGTYDGRVTYTASAP